MTAPVREIAAIIGRDLPALSYAHGPSHDPALTQPSAFRPITTRGAQKKPDGGLWTAPTTAYTPDGTPARNAWTDWCRDNEYGEATHLLIPIQPTPDARVLLIDSLADLHALVVAYPAHYGLDLDPILREVFPDWPRLAADGWDAVYLTKQGEWETRWTSMPDPNLYGWDLPTVLWLRPSYSVAA